jgi:2,5-diamino-6-(ribosylamino)-4(3H)-pyrimidinone 5'-phosphate reductase
MKRPYVIINCAMSADGKIALPTKKQMRISSDEDIKRMYTLRNQADAVLVGVGTILTDDPKLTVKEKYVKNPKQPLRIVLDSKCRTPKDSLVLNNNAKTLILTSKGKEKSFENEHITVVGCSTDSEGYIDLIQALDYLSQIGVEKLLVEGGGTIIWSFLEKKLVDDLYVYIGPFIIGGKDSPTVADGKGVQNIETVLSLKIIEINRLGNGIVIHYKMIK